MAGISVLTICLLGILIAILVVRRGEERRRLAERTTPYVESTASSEPSSETTEESSTAERSQETSTAETQESTTSAPATTAESTTKVHSNLVAVEDFRPTDDEAYTSLMNSYFTAVREGDTNLLKSLVTKPEEYTMSSKKRSEYIEAYRLDRIYILPIKTTDYKILYITYKMKFKGIQTEAPSLIRLLVKAGENQKPLVVNTDPGTEVTDAIQTAQSFEVIRNLIKDINTAFETACASDVGLNALVEKLKGEQNP